MYQLLTLFFFLSESPGILGDMVVGSIYVEGMEVDMGEDLEDMEEVMEEDMEEDMGGTSNRFCTLFSTWQSS